MISLKCVTKMKIMLVFSNIIPDAYEEIDYYRHNWYLYHYITLRLVIPKFKNSCKLENLGKEKNL